MSILEFPERRDWRAPFVGMLCTQSRNPVSLNEVEGVCAACGHDECEVLYEPDEYTISQRLDAIDAGDPLPERKIALYRCRRCGLEQGATTAGIGGAS